MIFEVVWVTVRASDSDNFSQRMVQWQNHCEVWILLCDSHCQDYCGSLASDSVVCVTATWLDYSVLDSVATLALPESLSVASANRTIANCLQYKPNFKTIYDLGDITQKVYSWPIQKFVYIYSVLWVQVTQIYYDNTNISIYSDNIYEHTLYWFVLYWLQWWCQYHVIVSICIAICNSKYSPFWVNWYDI